MVFFSVFMQYIYLSDFVTILCFRLADYRQKMRLAFLLLASCFMGALCDRTPCEHKCYPYRIKCHGDCRRDFFSNSFKEKFQACSEKCERYFTSCDDECECRALNIRERAGCEEICRMYPYLDGWNRRQCMMECKYDFSENYSKC